MKRKWLIVVLVIIFFGLGFLSCFLINKFLWSDTEKESNTIDIYSIEPIVKKYLEFKDKNLYLYNTNEVRLKYDGEIITLEEYIKNYKNVDEAFASLETYLEKQKELKDGGTIIYKNKNNDLFVNDTTIIKCNTSDGNKDIYFGEYMVTLTAFQNGACGKNFFTDKTFTRVYTIEKIKELDSKVENNKKYFYLELTIKDDDGNKITINRIMDSDSRNIISEGHKFTFSFTNKYGELIKEDIKEIFEKCTINGVAPYEK